MMDSNSAFFRALTYRGFVSNDRATCISIFSGTAPTEETIASFTSGDIYQVTSLLSAIEESSTLLANLTFEASITSEFLGDDNFVIPLSDSTRELIVKATGTASFFIMYAPLSNTVSLDPSESSGLSAYQILVGSVGSIGSGEDLELPDSEISLLKDYKCSDINVSLT